MKVPKNPAIAVFFVVHNHGALVPSISRIAGSDFAMFLVDIRQKISNYFLEVSRVNITSLNTDDQPCTDEKNDNKLETTMGPDGLITLDQCILNFYHRELNCTLPWGK